MRAGSSSGSESRRVYCGRSRRPAAFLIATCPKRSLVDDCPPGSGHPSTASVAMRHRFLLIFAAGALSAGCASEQLVTPASSAGGVRAAGATLASAQAAAEDDPPVVSPFLAQMNAGLAAAGSNLRVAKAEFIVDTAQWTGA